MKKMLLSLLFCITAAFTSVVTASAATHFTDSCDTDKAHLASTGRNRYFVLEPGYQLVLEGKEKGKTVVLTITVLNENQDGGGVERRVVEEKETANGQVVEISRNYFAVSTRTGDVFYFGEDVDIYKDGKVAGHEGAWLSGVNGARFGTIMPGTPLLGARYQQEVAPEVAMDRAEVVSLTDTLQTPAGTFENCLKTEESSAIEAGKEHKVYASGIG